MGKKKLLFLIIIKLIHVLSIISYQVNVGCVPKKVSAVLRTVPTNTEVFLCGL